LVDDDLPRHSRRGLRLRMDEGSVGVGVVKVKVIHGDWVNYGY
jgi:hypothetical protein